MSVRFAMILAGGKEDRLSIISAERAKAAVPFGGFYRLIDFSLSNCVNSGIFDVGILTQYQPRSLIDHIGVGRPWDLDRKRGGVELLQPYLSRSVGGWYRGTGDALFQNWNIIERKEVDNLLVLSGDHAYLMDYSPLVDYHRESSADITLVVTRVAPDEAHRFGVVENDSQGRVIAFEEKPSHPSSDIVFMGIYVFRLDYLHDKLRENAEQDKHDLVQHVVREGLGKARIHSYFFNDSWWDAGTLRAYWEANMHLLEPVPRFNLYDPGWVVYTNRSHKPPALLGKGSKVHSSIVGEGALVRGEIVHSVIFPGVVVEEGARVVDSIIFNDSVVKRKAVVDTCILDKNVEVGKEAVVGVGDDYTKNSSRPELLNWGVNLVGKGSRIPPGFVIHRNCLVGIEIGRDYFSNISELASGSTLL